MDAGASVMLVRSGGAAALSEWQDAFARVLPEIEVRDWDDRTVDPAHVVYVLVWEPEPGRIASYRNLRAIFSTAAGVDHITCDPSLPTHLPIIRMGAEEMAETVGEYVCLAALALLRDMPRMLASQRAGKWDQFYPSRTARQTRVGILGAGRIGKITAAMLRGIGFPTSGWTRTARDLNGMRGFAGMAELDAFLAGADMLVNVLPDTPEPRGLLHAERLQRLPHGASLINVGRGTVVVMADLLAALDRGQLSRAVLDVFPTEPPPPDDPAWRHPGVIVTAHIAGYASRLSRAQNAARAVRRIAAGEVPDHLFNRELGY